MASGVLTYDNFNCSKCGACCRNQKAVLLTVHDIIRMSGKLGLKPGEFFKKYCTISAKFSGDGLKRFYLKVDGGCPFLKDNLCSVHDVKPVACARNPFYYIQSSLAAYKVFGLIEDECRINEYSYDTMTKGENESLIDMDILVKGTDEYIAKYGRFDEKTAMIYDQMSHQDLQDPGLRSLIYNTLIQQAIDRENLCRIDVFYQGATNMYMSGFYSVFKHIVKDSDGAYAFEPSGLGMIDNIATVVIPEKDYVEVKKRLGQRSGAEVRTIASVHEGREYVIISIEPENGKSIIFYYHIEPGEKRILRHGPGEVLIDFKSEKGGSFIFRGKDSDHWLSQATT